MLLNYKYPVLSNEEGNWKAKTKHCRFYKILYAQVISQFLALPLFLTPGQTLWLTIFVIPMLSMSLLGPKSPDKDVMNISTGKNQVIVDRNGIKYSLFCYGSKFAPALTILILSQGLKNRVSIKVETLWKGHKIWKNLPPVLTKQLFLLSSIKTSGRFFQIFVA